MLKEGTKVIDESRWNEKGIYRVHNLAHKSILEKTLSAFIGKGSLFDYAYKKFNEGNGQMWFMGWSQTYYGSDKYNITKYRVYFDLVIQQVNTSIWIDIHKYNKK